MNEQIEKNSNGLEKNNRGRPTVMTAETIINIIVRLQRGFTIEEVCEDVGIGERTFYDFQKNNRQFSHRVRLAKTYYKMMAADIIFDVLHDQMRVKYNEETGNVIKRGYYTPKTRVTVAKFILESQSPRSFGKS